MTRYYAKFIEKYADIAAPLHNLTKKSVIFTWGDKEQEAFDTLREALTSPPVLALVDANGGKIVITTDASDRAIGGVLSQVQQGEEKPLAYYSRVLQPAKTNYCVTHKELLAIIQCIATVKKYFVNLRKKLW